jgi:hypothetical protein
MKMMYCWRCQMNVPMLDEEEFAVIDQLYSQGVQAIKEFRAEHGVSLDEISVHDFFHSVREAYQRMTGMDEANENAILHHRISIYGPPCQVCGKPLRTPRASFCAACGAVKEQPS